MLTEIDKLNLNFLVDREKKKYELSFLVLIPIRSY